MATKEGRVIGHRYEYGDNGAIIATTLYFADGTKGTIQGHINVVVLGTLSIDYTAQGGGIAINNITLLSPTNV